ncbi:hypothetical protein C0995_003415 [Termitomyces sp. Mi166|nr:hypothetical protein C0995_003415 [Termitomyces sp. Mi166\
MSESKELPVGENPVLPPANGGNAFPEGGTQGWLTLLGASLMQFSTFGHHLMIAGAFLHAFSYFMLSLSHEQQYYQVFLSQGLGVSIFKRGSFSLPNAGLGIVSHYFQRHRPLAMGIVAVGAAVGAVLHPIMLNRLFHGSVGFHNGVRISAAMNTVLLIIANGCMRTRLPPKKTGSALPFLEFMRDPAYLFCVIGGPLFICGLFFPVFFLQLDAINHGVDGQLAFYCISVLNAASIFGRVIPTIFVPKLGVFNLIISFTLGILFPTSLTTPIFIGIAGLIGK